MVFVRFSSAKLQLCDVDVVPVGRAGRRAALRPTSTATARPTSPCIAQATGEWFHAFLVLPPAPNYSYPRGRRTNGGGARGRAAPRLIFDGDRQGGSRRLPGRRPASGFVTPVRRRQFSLCVMDVVSHGGEPGGRIRLSTIFDGRPPSRSCRLPPATGEWLVLISIVRTTAMRAGGSYQWGQSGDLPVVADFDGDGRPT
jgi:hypothetical protein